MFILNVFNEVRELPWFVVVILFFVPFVGGLGWYFYKTRHARLWRKGIYPQHLKFNDDNLLEAYLALGALLVLLDYQRSKGKTQFINSYFNRYFPKANYNFGDSLLFSMRHPIQVDTVCDWLKLHLKDEAERAQVIYFLSGLALINGKLEKRELSFLTLMTEKLELPPHILKRNISIFEAYFASHKAQQERTTKPRKTVSKDLQYRRVLGVAEDADQASIKKAYRNLAKHHHPDVFANASPAQQAMAKEKFQQIQEAYDFLSK